MSVDGLNATTAVILSFPLDGNELLWQLGKEREASQLPIAILGHEFIVEASVLDPWDASRRFLIMRKAIAVSADPRPRRERALGIEAKAADSTNPSR